MTTGDKKAPMDKTDFAEKKADELMKHHLEDMGILSKQAELTFAFVMTTFAATFGYFIKLYEPATKFGDQDWLALAPILALSLHICLAGCYLVLHAMFAAPVETPGNLPATLLGEGSPGASQTLDELRLSEMWGLAERALKNQERNLRTGVVINNTRTALLATPITYLGVWALVQVLG